MEHKQDEQLTNVEQEEMNEQMEDLTEADLLEEDIRANAGVFRSDRVRRGAAWIMLVLFLVLVINLMFFRVLLVESVMLYIGMVVVFFFGRGMQSRPVYPVMEEAAPPPINDDKGDTDGQE